MTSAELTMVTVLIMAVVAVIFALWACFDARLRVLEQRAKFYDEWRKAVSRELDLHTQWMRVTQDDINSSRVAPDDDAS